MGVGDGAGGGPAVLSHCAVPSRHAVPRWVNLQQRSPRHSASLCTMQCTMQNPPVIPKDEFRRMRWHAWSCIQALYVQLTGIGCAHMLHLPFEELSVVFVETNDDSASIISASLWRACRI